MKRAALSVATIFIILALRSLLFEQDGAFPDDPGVGWHLKTGEVISATHDVPHRDPFLAPRRSEVGVEGGRPWVCDQWLADFTLFELKRVGGYALLFGVCVALYLFTFFGIVGGVVRQSSPSALCALAAVVVAFTSSQVHFILRPVIFTIFLFALVYQHIRAVVVTSDVGPSARSAVYLSVIFVVWANLHPAFVQGLLLVGLTIPALALEGRLNQRRLVALLGLCSVSAAATLLNPNGFDLIESIFALANDRYLLALNQEWRPLFKSESLFGFPAIMFLLLTIVPLALGLLYRGRLGKGWGFDLLASAVFTAEALLMLRCVPFAAIVSAPLAARVYAFTIVSIPWPRCFNLSRRFFESLDRHERTSATWIPVSALCAALAIGVAALTPALLPKDSYTPSPRIYDHNMLQAITRSASTGTILATPDLGGFITAELFPNFRAVIDDRNTMLGAQSYRDYFESMRSLDALRREVAEFGVTHIILPSDSTLIGATRAAGWCSILYEGETWHVCQLVDTGSENS